ncbi:hypothetical protein BgiMline_027317 [Biomphalaria glabrata]|nr:hypothetical protein BgiMline_025119 [Biomphalaria glabrata]
MSDCARHDIMAPQTARHKTKGTLQATVAKQQLLASTDRSSLLAITSQGPDALLASPLLPFPFFSPPAPNGPMISHRNRRKP